LPSTGVSIIVFYKNTGEDLFFTLDTIQNALSGISHEIIVVDDASSNVIIEDRIFQRNKFVIKFIRLNTSLGISGAIFEGLKFCNFDIVLPIPGHNLFSTGAIRNVCNLAGEGRIVIGNRVNYSENRPLIKISASKTLNFIYKRFFFSTVDDIHGLILFKKCDLQEFGASNSRHGLSVLVVTSVLADGGILIKTSAPINLDHKNRKNRKFSDSFPQPKSILSVLVALKKAYKIL
jgi:glycosyltransferase involved in cell wall biosynthesis